MVPLVGVRVITTISAVILLAGSGFSQSRGGATAPTTGGSPSAGGTAGAATAGRPTGIPSTAPNSNSTTTLPQGTILITGRVVLEDGGPPPDTVSIERVCTGSTKAEGYTDSKGYFAIELGNEKSVFQDASETGNYGNASALGSVKVLGPGGAGATGGNTSSGTRYSTCDLRARLTGYRSQTVSLNNRRPMDDPNIGTILLHREGHDEGTIVSAVSLTAPHEARRAFEKGLQDGKKGKTDEAEKEFQKAVEIYPHYANAWNELGRIQASRGQTDAARRSFETAIKADPKYVNPYLQLSVIEMDAGSWRELVATTAQALRLDPFDYPTAYLYNAVGNWNMKDIDAAEKSILQADKLDGQHQIPDISRMMGMILLQRHDYAGAAEKMRLFLKLDPDSKDAVKIRVQLAQVEKLLAQNAATASSKQDQ